jgi:hypothetical protein
LDESRHVRTARGARPTVELLQVPLDGLGVARLRVVGIVAGVPQGAALAQQVPAAVQLDLDRAQALPVLVERGGVGAVGLLARTQPVLLGNELLDAGRRCCRRSRHRCYPSRVSPLRLVWGMAAVTQA